MNKAEWDAMKRRDKDAIVAETVMGWMKLNEPEFLPPDQEMDWCNSNGYATVLPMFTTDRNACVLVLDEVEKRGLKHRILHVMNEADRPVGEFGDMWFGFRVDPGTICYCAIKAVEDEPKE